MRGLSRVLTRPAEATAAGPAAVRGGSAPESDFDADEALAFPRKWLWLALALSLGVHCLFLILIGQLEVSPSPRHLVQEIRTYLLDEPPLAEALVEPVLAIAEPDDQPREAVLATEMASAASLVSQQPVVAPQLDSQPIDDADLEIPPLEVVAATQLNDVLVRPGAAGEQVAHSEGAVDRLAYEIAAALAQSDVLVVWLMDASISLAPQRDRVAERLERIYGEIAEAGEVAPRSLLGAVFRYGAESSELVAPTDDGQKIVAAIRNVAPDESGVENVFTCVLAAVDKYKNLRTRQGRKIMLINWTDESGDDLSRLEDAVRVCRKLAVPVYTVGPTSMFGRRQGTVPYRHPENDEIYDLPVDRGPDTARQELLRLPFWFEGPQFENLTAGLGPYALVRLANETGGAYFINDAAPLGPAVLLDAMRQYLPDYSSADAYVRNVAQSGLRQAVLRAVDLTYQRELKGTPQVSFAPTGTTFQQELTEAQRSVAFNLLTLQAALSVFTVDLEKQYQQERSARWRAWYDLTLGRLLAMHVRCNEYNWACGVMKGKGAEFVDKQSNRWQFVPDTQINFGTAIERQAAEAIRLLTRCVEQNPGTPWALMAQRELDHPLGFRVQEAYVAPPPMLDLAGNNNPDDPGGIREEEMRRIRREQVTLPKL